MVSKLYAKGIKDLLSKLEHEHLLYNQNVSNYKEDGEEDFEIWLNWQVKQFLKEKE